MTITITIPFDYADIIRARDATLKGVAMAGASVELLQPQRDRKTILGLWRLQEELRLAADILEAVRAAADPLRGDFNAEAECPTN